MICENCKTEFHGRDSCPNCGLMVMNARDVVENNYEEPKKVESNINDLSAHQNEKKDKLFSLSQKNENNDLIYRVITTGLLSSILLIEIIRLIIEIIK